MSKHSSGGGPEWWLRYAQVSESERGLLQRRAHRFRLVMSIVLIGGGVLLFLSNLGVIALANINLYLLWPVLPMVGGFGAFTNGRRASARVWGAFLMLFGGLFLLLNLGWIHVRLNNNWPLALLLLAAGFAALFNVLESSRRNGPQIPPASEPAYGPSPQEAFVHRTAASPPPPRPSPSGSAPWARAADPTMNDYVVFGSLKRRVNTRNFQGGDMTTVFGDMEIDLRQAAIAPPDTSAVVNIFALFGAAKLRVPREWRIHVSGTSLFANFEDKTIPPNTGPSAPMLVIAGWSIFSSVEILD